MKKKTYIRPDVAVWAVPVAARLLAGSAQEDSLQFDDEGGGITILNPLDGLINLPGVVL